MHGLRRTLEEAWQISGKCIDFSQKEWNSWISIGKMFPRLLSNHTNKKINSRFIKILDVISKVKKKPFEDNIRECLYGLRVEKNLLNKSLKSDNCKGKVLYSASLK